ncbi:MAG: hypothetical protein A6F70_10295 [Cycloclasticus sp. symbiont of Bathymodiolus heckerae]|nr:MAG: hypothetical protein A6F70_10295 [Cycloclasticus sp. symbiont of Bathymodiolus heckerae]
MGIAKEQEQLEEYLKTPFQIEKYKGNAWFQLSEAEREVFALEYEDMRELAAVHTLYFCAIGISEEIETSRIDSLKKELPWLTEMMTDPQEWKKFAALFGIPNRKAAAFFYKHEFWETRNDLAVYADEQKQ